jgi:glutamate mutase epsilon subunit
VSKHQTPVSPEVAAGREKGNLLHYPDSRHGDVISLCLNGDIGFCEGNVIKYVTRWRKKNGLEDLYKAKTYLDRLIRFYKNKDINNV